MTVTKPNPIFRLMPSLADIAFLLPVIFLFTRLQGVRTLLGDGDTGWHIRIGEWILAHHSVPKTDLFSFTRPDAPFIAWEWLWDAGAAMLHARFGLGGVVLASLVVLCLTFALLFRLVEQRCGNGIVALLITALAAAGSAIHWLARPHLVTWLFIVITLTILERVRQGHSRLLWLLPPLTILWTNLHGGFLAGILILCMYGAGELIPALWAADWGGRLHALRVSLPYFATAVASLAASLVNPYFYHLHQHMIEYLLDPYQMNHINEFQSVNFRYSTTGYFEVMMALAFGSIIWAGMRGSFREALLIVGWAQMSLMAVRNVPIFMLVAAPAASVAVAAWIGTLRQAAIARWIRNIAEFFCDAWQDIAGFERIWRVHLISLLVLAFIGAGMALPSPNKMLQAEYDRKGYPYAVLPLLKDPAERIFTHDEWGDFLIYQLSPLGVRVYVDGRSDFYGHDFGEEYISLLNVKYDWEQTLAKYGVNTVLMPPDAPLASTLKESGHWRVVYDDGSVILFRLRTGAPAVQVSTSSPGGRLRDSSITHEEGVIFEDHVVRKGARTL